MLANLSQREKILLGVALIVIVVTGYYFYIYIPAQEELANLEETIEQRRNRLEVAREYASKTPELKEEYREVQEEYLKRGQYEDKSVIDLLIDFREIARENNVTLVRFTPSTEDEEIDMNVQLQGEFRQLTDLFSDFREWNYWFEFKQLQLNGDEDRVDISMSVTYHEQQEEGED